MRTEQKGGHAGPERQVQRAERTRKPESAKLCSNGADPTQIDAPDHDHGHQSKSGKEPDMTQMHKIFRKERQDKMTEHCRQKRRF